MSRIARAVVLAVVAASFASLGGAAFAEDPQACPEGTKGVVVGFPNPDKPYYVCARNVVGG